MNRKHTGHTFRDGPPPPILPCQACLSGKELGFDISMAFQPIVDVERGTVFAQEALVRGPSAEGAGWVFEKVNDENRYQFDQVCRVKAIELASKLGVDCYLSINFMPNAVYEPARCIRTTLEAASQFHFPVDRIIFEFTESEKVYDLDHVKRIVRDYQQRGFKTAIDDFGAGYAGLNFLAELQTDIIKLDMALIRGIDSDRVRHAIIRGVLAVCQELSIDVIAEGVETKEEFRSIRDLGVKLFQGYYFAKPSFESLSEVAPELFLS